MSRSAVASVEVIARIQKYASEMQKIPGVTEKAVAQAAVRAEREHARSQIAMAKASEKAAANAGTFWDRAGSTAAGAFAGLVSMDVLGWIKESITDVTELRQTILTMSDATGIGVDTLSAIEVASERAGVEFKTVADVFEDFAGSVVDFARDGTGKGANAFRELGIQAKDSGGRFRDTDDVLREFLGKVQSIGDETQRSGYLVQTFSDKAGQLQRVLGSVNIEDLVAASERFGVTSAANADAARDWAAATGSLSLAMRASVTDMIEAVSGPKMSDAINRFALGWVFATNLLTGSIRVLGHDFGQLAQLIGSTMQLDPIMPDFSGIEGLRDAYRSATEAARDLHTLQTSAANAAGPTAGGPALIDKAADAKAAADAKSADARAEAAAKQAAAESAAAKAAAAAAAKKRAEEIADASGKLSAMLTDYAKDAESASEAIKTAFGDQIDEIARLEAVSGDHITAEAARHEALRQMLRDTAELEAEVAAKAAEERDKATKAQIDAMIEIARHRDADLKEAQALADQRLQNEQAIQGGIFDASQAALSGIADLIQQNAGETKSAQLRAFAATKAIAVAQIALSTAAAIANALATPPYPVGAALAITAGIAGAAQLAAALAAKPQIHHSGRFNAAMSDERPALLQKREVVVPAQQVDRAGGPDGVRRRLDGDGGSGQITVVVDMSARRIMAELARDVRGYMSVPALAGWG